MVSLRSVALLFLVVTGCSTQLYDGPARPDSDISVVSLLRAEPNMTFGGVVIDGRSVQSARYGFSTDFHLLPGSHTIAFNYRIDADAYCDVREHLCPAIVVTGQCAGSFATQAGRSYVAELVDRKESVGAVIREALSIENLTSSSSGPLAALQCEQVRRHSSADVEQTGMNLGTEAN